MKSLDTNKFISEATNWLKSYVEKAGLKGFVLGVSGGVDSAVVSTLCAKTGLPVLCLEMPIHQDPSHTVRSTNHINWLKQQFPNVSSTQVDLTKSFDAIVEAFHNAKNQAAPNFLAEANTRSRLRMATTYYYANCNSSLVAGTGNKVEDFGIGFCTKGGDQIVDLSPIGDITKSEVWDVARVLGINQEIIDAKPTDGLWAGSPSDEDQIGASYPELEWAMEFKATHIDPLGDGATNSGVDSLVAVVGKKETENVERKKEVMRIFLKRHRANRHKMDPIPVFETNSCR